MLYPGLRLRLYVTQALSAGAFLPESCLCLFGKEGLFVSVKKARLVKICFVSFQVHIRTQVFCKKSLGRWQPGLSLFCFRGSAHLTPLGPPWLRCFFFLCGSWHLLCMLLSFAGFSHRDTNCCRNCKCLKVKSNDLDLKIRLAQTSVLDLTATLSIVRISTPIFYYAHVLHCTNHDQRVPL